MTQPLMDMGNTVPPGSSADPAGTVPPAGAGRRDEPGRPDRSGRPLVIGYGNPLRRDDGVGWHVANALAADPRAAGVDVIAAHQLAPEFAHDLSTARVAVLVDARVGTLADGARGPAPGSWAIERLGARPADQDAFSDGAKEPRLGAWSHHCTPRSLATLAERLYGTAAPITVVGVGVLSVDSGEHLTAPVSAAVPALVNVIVDLVGIRDPGPSSAEGRHHA